MAKVYAKNPTDPLSNPAEFVIDNPQPKQGKKMATSKKKNPKRVAAGKKAARARWGKNKKRKNPASGIAETGKSMLVKSIFAVGGGFAAAKLIGFGLNKFGDKLPAVVRDYTPMAAPVLIGSALGYYGKGNQTAQSAATGMVISGVNTGFKKLLPSVAGSDEQTQMSGLGDGDMILGSDGMIRTQQGVQVARAKLSGPGVEVMDSSQDEKKFLGDGRKSGGLSDVTYKDEEDELFVA